MTEEIMEEEQENIPYAQIGEDVFALQYHLYLA